MINQVVAHPTKPGLLFAAGRPQGALKSTDGGQSWRPARTGLKNTSAFHLAIAESNPEVLYLATFGGGIYRSTDGAESWVEANGNLGNTNIHALAVDPTDADRIIVAASTGELFRSVDGGRHWSAASQGLPAVQGDISAAFRFDHARPPRLYLGLEGLYEWQTSGGWRSIGTGGTGLTAAVITALAFDPAGRSLYAGTRHDGLFASTDRGAHWTPVAESFHKQWIHAVLFDHAQAPNLYVSVIASGLFKSGDRGATWQPLSKGLPPQEDVLGLAIDPHDPTRLYAGTRGQGIFLSSDGGAGWRAAAIAQEPLTVILDDLMAAPPPRRQSSAPLPPVPASFEKCTKCHGWTDPYLTRKRTFWRVPPNAREWQSTVARMSVGNNVTPAEQEEIIRFLNAYSRALQ
ncbi:MAG: hypothetical protein HY208_05610 [Nitrospirae bacterium]|nr:hypothetical protein [Nitrospirota bacterium]